MTPASLYSGNHLLDNERAEPSATGRLHRRTACFDPRKHQSLIRGVPRRKRDFAGRVPGAVGKPIHSWRDDAGCGNCSSANRSKLTPRMKVSSCAAEPWVGNRRPNMTAIPTTDQLRETIDSGATGEKSSILIPLRCLSGQTPKRVETRLRRRSGRWKRVPAYFEGRRYQ
jgi:hypothetical protein